MIYCNEVLTFGNRKAYRVRSCESLEFDLSVGKVDGLVWIYRDLKLKCAEFGDIGLNPELGDSYLI